MNQRTTPPDTSFFFSAETRWFIPGQVPDAILSWFLSGEYPLSPAARTDTYLLFPRATTAGAKFREERFEIKSLVEDHGPAEFTSGIRGTMQTWEKWSASGEPFQSYSKAPLQLEENWIEVQKRRFLKTFRVEDGSVSEADPGDTGDSPEEGCYAELTEVEIFGDLFWTIGLESFSTANEHLTHLKKAAQFFFAAVPPVDVELAGILHLENSLAYPSFLKSLTKS